MSEHATGNAVDILALGLADKRQIRISAVANELNPDHRLLMALRLTACGYCTTVLGPGANTAHANHYHLDFGVHGTSGNYRICKEVFAAERYCIIRPSRRLPRECPGLGMITKGSAHMDQVNAKMSRARCS
jgi:extensin-like protein